VTDLLTETREMLPEDVTALAAACDPFLPLASLDLLISNQLRQGPKTAIRRSETVADTRRVSRVSARL